MKVNHSVDHKNTQDKWQFIMHAMKETGTLTTQHALPKSAILTLTLASRAWKMSPGQSELRHKYAQGEGLQAVRHSPSPKHSLG